jgi:hypothetical protein
MTRYGGPLVVEEDEKYASKRVGEDDQGRIK